MSVSTLRRVPVPDCEPPFDDQAYRPDRVASARVAGDAVQGTLALAFLLPSGLPAVPTAPPELHLVPRPEAAEQEDVDEFGPQPTSSADLPEARSWAGRFAQAVVEVVAGDRPAAQLIRWTSSEVYDDIAALITSTSGRTESPRGVVRSVHVSVPADGIAEVAALVRRGARCTALALRLEGLDGRWQCTALELG